MARRIPNKTDAQGRRARKCARYIDQAGSVSTAMKLAARQGFRASSSIWIKALGNVRIARNG